MSYRPLSYPSRAGPSAPSGVHSCMTAVRERWDGLTNVGKFLVVLFLVVIVLVSLLAIFGVFGSSSTDTPVDYFVGGGSNLVISVLPDPPPPPPSRRSERRAYTSADTTPTEYDLFIGSQEVNVPGSDTLDTVNLILCFLASSGVFAVDPVVTAGGKAFSSLVDMSKCQKGERNSQKQMFLVTVYNLTSTSGTANSTYSGNVGFRMRSTDTTDLRAEIALTLHSVNASETCPGVAIKSEAGSLTSKCWSGYMRWKEGSRMAGYFLGAYDASDEDFPVSLEFKEHEQRNSSLVMRMSPSGDTVRAKMTQQTTEATVYYCINANSTHARLSKAADEESACASTSSGGMCLSRSDKTIYPFSFRLFADSTGASVSVAGITNLNLDYVGDGDVRCHAGVSSSGSWTNCGSGDSSGIATFADGTAATDSSGTAYTLHNSNARIEKLTIKSVTFLEFSAGAYMSYFSWVQAESKFFNFILGRSGSNNTLLAVHYKRYALDGGAWSNFTAGAEGETLFVGTGDIQFQPCKTHSMWYTGAYKPTPDDGFRFTADYRQRTYAPSDGMVYFPVSSGLLSSSADVDLVCPVLCTRLDSFSGTCFEFSRCPKTVHSGLTLGSTCTGSMCTSFNRVSDTAYVYKFKANDHKLYALQNNVGTTTEATVIDSTTGVTYDASMQWQQTTTSRMYEATDASTLNTPTKLANYMKVSGNVYYDVGIGMPGGYSGWSFYAKLNGEFVELAAPISCKVVMGEDVNGNTAHAGSVLYLTMYNGFTQGLRFDALNFGNTQMGSRQLYVPSPQLPDATQCVADDGTIYRLKSEYSLVIPRESTGSCSTWSTMTSAGALPSTIPEPSNAAGTMPTATDTCVSERALTNAGQCAYYPGVTSA